MPLRGIGLGVVDRDIHVVAERVAQDTDRAAQDRGVAGVKRDGVGDQNLQARTLRWNMTADRRTRSRNASRPFGRPR